MQRNDKIKAGHLSKIRDPDHIRQWLFCREHGQKPSQGWKNNINTQLYSSIRTVKSWVPDSTVDQTHHGSIFNLGFSTDGSILAAACEKGSILLFDAFNGSLIEAKNKAHGDCVNCVRFLDSRTFSTCSDDHTVCLWDVRYLKNQIRTLRGHSHWVKNMDYARNAGLLLTSGFDGCIYTWDINSYSDKEPSSGKKVFHSHGLMRSCLSPDASKLIISTNGGYIMVIHNLYLETLESDLKGFLPNMYRLMQLSTNQSGLKNRFSHLFTRNRNRVEIIGDFPSGDDAEMITSLEVHPHGWCVGTRNTTADEYSEWTCVHDIQGSKDDYQEDPPAEPEEKPQDRSLHYKPSTSSNHTSQSRRSSQSNHNARLQTRSLVSQMISGLRDITSGPDRAPGPLSVSIRLLPPSPNLATTPVPSESSSDDSDDDSDDNDALNSRDLFPGPWDNLLEGYNLPSNAARALSSVLSSYPPPYIPASPPTMSNVEDNNSPVYSPSSPVYIPSSPPARGQSGTSDANSPVYSPSSPVYNPSYPVYNPSSPVYIPASPPPTPNSGARGNVPRANLPVYIPSAPVYVPTTAPLYISSSNVSSRNITTTLNLDFRQNSSRADPPPYSPSSPVASARDLQGDPDNPTLFLDGFPQNVAFSFNMGGGEVGNTQSRLGFNINAANASSSATSDNVSDIIYRSIPRLTHYIEEPNVGRGYIKELSFSHDGRLICSPFGYGVRLLAFDPSCQEICDCLQESAMQLYEVACNMSHSREVLTTKFSPTHHLLVSGCLNGKVDFHQPVI